MFLNNFDNQADVEREFELTPGELNNCKILIAAYNTGDYEGDAFVLFQEDGKLYEVHASHCSCMGLEGQFSPEETSVEALEHYITEGEWQHRQYVDELKELIIKLKKGNAVKKVTYFEATDGTKFDDEDACVAHEELHNLANAMCDTDIVKSFTDADPTNYLIVQLAEWLLENYSIEKK
jgi:hypothetical protein